MEITIKPTGIKEINGIFYVEIEVFPAEIREHVSIDGMDIWYGFHYRELEFEIPRPYDEYVIKDGKIYIPSESNINEVKDYLQELANHIFGIIQLDYFNAMEIERKIPIFEISPVNLEIKEEENA